MIEASANNLAPLLFVVFISQYHIGLGEAGGLALVNFIVQFYSIAPNVLSIKSEDVFLDFFF